MKLWLVLENKSVKIGTEKKETQKYREYQAKMYDYEKEYDSYYDIGFPSGPVKPIEPSDDEKYEDVPLRIDIPRIVAIRYTDPEEEFKDRLFNKNNPYKNYVWIEEIDIENDEVVANYKLKFKSEKEA